MRCVLPDLEAHYSYGLVVVSVCISICAAFASLSLSDGMRAAATRRLWAFWLVSGSFAMGMGIWALDFLGMLALQLPVPIFYFWPTVLLSMLLAAAVSCIALNVVGARHLSAKRLLLGGAMMGIGLAAMYYTGMASMRSHAVNRYDPRWVILSVFAAVGFSWMALGIAAVARGPARSNLRMRVAAGLVMGLGIAAMHYTAMTGVRFTLRRQPFSMANVIHVDGLGQSLITLVTCLVLAMAFSMATLDLWRSRELKKAHQALASQKAMKAEQVRLQKANHLLSELSVRDGLTGLYNRRYFDEALKTEWRRAVRNDSPLSLLMIDLDFFKSLNDLYGHPHGDSCLRTVAKALQERHGRAHDVLARYGGEEFALLLPGADLYAAREVGESLRRLVRELGIGNEGSRVDSVVTVSVGVHCTTLQSSTELEQFVQETDAALYRAKHLGRDRVETVAPGGESFAGRAGMERRQFP